MACKTKNPASSSAKNQGRIDREYMKRVIKMNRFYFTGYYKNERITGISEIKTIINKHGFILDFKMISDISLSMVIETEESKVDLLFADLKRIMKMDDFETLHTNSHKECTVLFNVTFSRGKGDLRIETPAVPG